MKTKRHYEVIFFYTSVLFFLQCIAILAQTETITPSITETITTTITETISESETFTETPTLSITITDTGTEIFTATITESITETSTETITMTVTLTFTPTLTLTMTPSITETLTRTITLTFTNTIPSFTFTVTNTITPSYTITTTLTPVFTAIIADYYTQHFLNIFYPNPVKCKEDLFMLYKCDEISDIIIGVYTVDVKKIKEFIFEGKQGTGKIKITINDIAPGIYFYRTIIKHKNKEYKEAIKKLLILK